MIDVLIAEPTITQRELAKRFERSENWVSIIMGSDAFQAALAKRRDDLTDPFLIATIEERFRGLAPQSLQVIAENLEKTRNTDLALKALDISSKALGFGAFKGNRIRESLKEKSLLVEIETRLGKGKTLAKFLVPTFETLRLLGLENNGGRGGAVHRHVQQMVKEQALTEGFAAVCERKIENGIVDVHLERDGQKLAVEISIVPNIERETGNINKCLAEGYTHVYCIFLDKVSLSKLEEQSRDIWTEDERNKIILLPLSSFSGFS